MCSGKESKEKVTRKGVIEPITNRLQFGKNAAEKTERGGKREMKFTRSEQETIINFNAEEEMASVYTRDSVVMRRMDTLVNSFPEVYRCTKATDIDKTYEMPKSYVSYRKPRKLSKEQREAARTRARSLRKEEKGGNTWQSTE